MTEAALTQPQPEEGIEPDDLDTKSIVAVGLISTALLVASVLGVTALVDQFERVEVKSKVYEVETGSLTYGDEAATVAQQQLELDGEAELADKPGVTLTPIDEVKKLVVEKYRSSGTATN